MKNVIFALHLLIFLASVSIPFIGTDDMLLVNTAFLIGVVLHWMLNNNMCALTQFEKWVTGNTDSSTTFFGQLFGDFYTKAEQWGHISWIVTIALIVYSIHKLIKRNVIQKFIYNVRHIQVQ